MSSATPHRSEDCVAILMATCNGGKYLSRQIESILRQCHTNLRIYISDDDSSDDTIALVRELIEQYGGNRISFRQRKFGNAAHNFFSLVFDNDIVADWFFFSDQDDVWLPEKVSHYLESCRGFQGIPCLVGGAYELLLENDVVVQSNYRKIAPESLSFSNSLIDCFAPGNTMMFNKLFRQSLLRDISNFRNVKVHDWFLYQYATYKELKTIYISRPLVHYRQHDNNLLGSPELFRNKMNRFLIAIQGLWRASLLANLGELRLVESSSSSNKAILEKIYVLLSSRNRVWRIFIFLRYTKIRRTSLMQTILFKIFV